ncbi:TPA: type 1 fimbrial protein [Klebsiella pneumoniae]|nr:protein FimF [Klebsiella pneumoniae]HCA9575736.1 type 1 fimbrial protein [Klebsiella pneumoniae]HCB1017012.1 type 1 fimbrial protein [Klebsiella pneumoniae]
MKKILILLSAIIMLVWTNSFAADSTITISGHVRDNTCVIASESRDLSVDLKNTSTKQLNSVGSTSPLIPFRIILSPCGDSVTAVKVSFTGTSDSDNAELLKIDGGSISAAGVAVQILNSEQKRLSINPPSTSIGWTKLKPGQANILDFYASMAATRVPVHAGHVFATAAFTLEFL